MAKPHNRADQRHAALRALAEGGAVSLARLAAAGGRSLRGLGEQARREGWVLAPAGRQDAAARVRQLAGTLLARLERLDLDGAGPPKAEIDGIIAMVRGLDKIGEIMRPGEAVTEDTGSDEDVAAALEAVNDRIVALARELAARLAAGDAGGAEAPPDPPRMGL